MSALKLVASNATPDRSSDPSIMAMLNDMPHSELVRFCVECGVLEHGVSALPRGELVTALFRLQANVRAGRDFLALTGASDSHQAHAIIDEWQQGATRAAELQAELLELEQRERESVRAPLEDLLAEGRRLFKLSPAMVNRWRGLFDDGEASVASLRNMLNELEPIPALANGRA